MRSLLLLVISAYFFILALRSRLAGLYVYWWYAIFRPHDWDWAGVIASYKLPLVAALLFVIPSLFQQKFPRFKHPIAKLIVFWFILVIIADLINGCGDVLMIRTGTVAILLMLFFVVFLTERIIENKKDLFWLICIIAISIGFHSGKGGIGAMLSGANLYDSNILSGLFSGSNAYALGTGMLLFFMIFSYRQINSKYVFADLSKWYCKPIMITGYKFALLLIIFGTFYNIIALQSRGSFLATTIGIIIFISFQKYRFRIFSGIFIVLAMILAFAPLPEGYIERIQSSFADEEERDQSAASRPHYWYTARLMAASNPLGVGPGCFPKYYSQFDPTYGDYGVFRSVHSSHFQILADSGYLGVIIWIILFIVSYRTLFKLKKLVLNEINSSDKQKFYIDLLNTLICTQTVFLIGGSFYEYAYNDIIWLVLILVITADKLIRNDKKKQESDKIEHKNTDTQLDLQNV